MLNQLYKNYYIYELILTKPDKNRTQIAIINYTSLSFNPRFRDIDNLTFTINYLEPVPYGQLVNPSFHDIKGNYLILMNVKDYNTNEIILSKYFVIENPKLMGVEKDSKELNCYSLEYKLNRRKLRGYTNVTLLYDNSGSNGLLNYMISNLIGSWTLGTMPSALLNQTRSFNYSESSYTEIFRDLEKIFSCVFTFDTVNNVINITMLDDVGTNYGLFINEENFMKSLNLEEKFDQITTKLFVYGSNNIGIYNFNVTGLAYLLDVSYFRSLDYMSQELLDAYDAYDVVLANNQTTFNGYLSSLDTLSGQLITKQNELNDLNDQLLIYLQNENSEIKQSGSTGQTYSYWYALEQTQRTAISSKQSEITGVQNSISAINANILILNQAVSLETNFSSSLLKELGNFIFEDSITISEINDEAILYQEALYQIGKRSTPPKDFSIDIADLFSIPSAEFYWDKMNMGDFVNVDYSKYNINCLPVRLVSYTHEPLNNSLKLDFSTTDKYNTDNFYTVQIWQKANQTTSTLTIERPNYSQYLLDKSGLLTNTSTIDSSNNTITLPDGSVIGNNGLIMADSSSSLNQMRILGNRILFTNNNWEGVTVGIDGDGIHSLNIYGSHIIGGDIVVETDIYVGNSIYVGKEDDLDKQIILHNDVTNGTSGIKLDADGILTFVNFGFMQILTDNKLKLDAAEGISITSPQILLTSGSGDMFQIQKLGGEDMMFLHWGSGNIFFSHVGTGVIKIESQNNMSIRSIDGTVFAQGSWKFDDTPYVSVDDYSHQLTTVDNVITLIGLYGDSGLSSAEVQSMIDTSIAAHVAALH